MIKKNSKPLRLGLKYMPMTSYLIISVSKKKDYTKLKKNTNLMVIVRSSMTPFRRSITITHTESN